MIRGNVKALITEDNKDYCLGEELLPQETRSNIEQGYHLKTL